MKTQPLKQNVVKRRRPSFNITLDKDVAAWVRRAAFNSNRSVSNFIEVCLRPSFEKRVSDKKRAAK